MKINEQWEELREKSHANIQSERGILKRNSFGVFYSVYNNTYEYFNLQSDYEVKEDGKHAGKVKYDDDESSTISKARSTERMHWSR